MSSRDRLHIIVIDDVVRFALHLWRYVADSPGFAIAEVPKRTQDGVFWKLLDTPLPNTTMSVARDTAPRGKKEQWQPVGLATPDGAAVVWWVEARDAQWQNQLRAVMDHVKTINSKNHWIALVDVRGAAPREASQGNDAGTSYKVDRVVAELKESHKGTIVRQMQGEPAGNIFLVSSYRRSCFLPLSESGRIPVFAKSGALFEQITKRLRSMQQRTDHTSQSAPRVESECVIEMPGDENNASSEARPRVGGLSFLVTGAGFEIADKLPGRALGLPATAELMKQVFKDNGNLGLDASDAPKWTREYIFPIPDIYTLEKDTENTLKDISKGGCLHLLESYQNLWVAAKHGDLDSYWNELLQLEILGRRDQDNERPRAKLLGVERELRLREAFRDVLLRFDWGQLQQALAAADGPFDAWLSTNYTRFANRAIQAYNHRLRGEDRQELPSATQHGPWRIVSTSNEATRLLQELVHTEPSLEEGTADGRSKAPRYAFKLHGDIPHVTTMALAGHDKEVSSPLSVPIDSLHLMYLVAERHLEVQTTGLQTVVQWHIVGHGLWDVPLKRLLHRVAQKSRQAHHVFFIVAPEISQEGETIWGRLLKSLPAAPNNRSWYVCCIEASAREYMTRIARQQVFKLAVRNSEAVKRSLDLQLQSLGFKSELLGPRSKWRRRNKEEHKQFFPSFWISWWRETFPSYVSSEILPRKDTPADSVNASPPESNEG